jgi:hypothetical protein
MVAGEGEDADTCRRDAVERFRRARDRGHIGRLHDAVLHMGDLEVADDEVGPTQRRGDRLEERSAVGSLDDQITDGVDHGHA